MDTEDRLERWRDADTWPAERSLAAMLDSQMAAFDAVRNALPALARAAEAAAERLGRGGRLVYAGAGASGRLAVQDGVELHPTFGWPRERLCYLIAGGEAALVRSVEGAEDDVAAAVAAVEGLALGARRRGRGGRRVGSHRVHLRRAAARACRRGADHRAGQQPGLAAARGGRDPGAAGDRAGVPRRLDPDGRRHGAEDRAQPLVDPDHDGARAGSTRASWSTWSRPTPSWWRAPRASSRR